MKKQILVLMTLIGFLGVAQAQARDYRNHNHYPQTETIDIVSWWGFRVGIGATETQKLDRNAYVENIVVQAQGASYSDGMMEVVVNGKVKGTIHVPGRDPSYVVTIAEETNSIQFRHISGGAISVADVKVTLNNKKSSYSYSLGANSTLSLPVRNEAMQIARETIAVIDVLQSSLSGSAFDQNLLPIKKAAAVLYAKASANGDLSHQVLRALNNLNATMEYQKGYIESALAVGSTFELGVALLTLHERVQATIR